MYHLIVIPLGTSLNIEDCTKQPLSGVMQVKYLKVPKGQMCHSFGEPSGGSVQTHSSWQVWSFSVKPGYALASLKKKLYIEATLLTGTAVNRHIGVHLQHNIFALIQEQNTQGVHCVGDTAGLWNAWNDPYSLHNALDCGMVRWPYDLEEKRKSLCFLAQEADFSEWLGSLEGEREEKLVNG